MTVTIELKYEQICDLARQLKPNERKQLIHDLESEDKKQGRKKTNATKSNNGKLNGEKKDGIKSEREELEIAARICASHPNGGLLVIDESVIPKEELEEYQRNYDAIAASMPEWTTEEREEHLKWLETFPVATEEEIQWQNEFRNVRYSHCCHRDG